MSADGQGSTTVATLPTASPATAAAPLPDPHAIAALHRSRGRQRPVSPLIKATVAWIAGVFTASLIPWIFLWALLACVTVVGSLVRLRAYEGKNLRPWGLAALTCVGGLWFILCDRFVSGDHLSQFVTAEPRLAQITGEIDGPVIVTAPQRGQFARFSYEPPSTTFTVRVDSINVKGQMQPTTGRLTAKLREAHTGLREGDAVAITGWMQAIDGPSNPGDFDFRPMYRERGIDGRITLNVRGNCKVTEPASAAAGLSAVRTRVAEACAASLRIGLANEPARVAFLDTILLGRWSRDLDELSESFRKTGLIHVLSISGAHLTILMLLVWWAVQLVSRNPRMTALAVLAVLLIYMLAVPWRAPIVRAGIMAGLVGAGIAISRRVRAIDMIALSALLILIWRPGDLFNAGAQLSFGVVAALIVFTTPVSQWLWPDPLVEPDAEHPRFRWSRWLVDFLAANIVAFVIAFPLVAFHFQFISPLSILLSLLALPVVTAVIGLGYLKILLGTVLPSAGSVLAGPLEWVSDTMIALVGHAAQWPASTVMLGSAPDAFWLLATLAFGCALLAGAFARRRAVLAVITVALSLWLLVPHHPRVASWIDALRPQPALKLNMFAVGDGSCFLLRVTGDDASKPHTVMFDCGSQGFLDVGNRSIVPSLRALHVNRIDTFIISHADIDHFCGALDVADEIPIGRVLVPPQLLREAEEDKDSAAHHLIEGLAAKRIVIDTVSRGWSEPLGRAEAKVLWPPADFSPERANSSSLVLAVTVAGRRVLLSGDIDQEATPKLLEASDDLRADVADLPHHGSFVQSSPRWFAAVKPTFVLQSSGPARLRGDRWADLLQSPSVTRLVTANLGMVEVIIEGDGAIRWSSFRTMPVPAEP